MDPVSVSSKDEHRHRRCEDNQTGEREIDRLVLARERIRDRLRRSNERWVANERGEQQYPEDVDLAVDTTCPAVGFAPAPDDAEGDEASDNAERDQPQRTHWCAWVAEQVSQRHGPIVEPVSTVHKHGRGS